VLNIRLAAIVVVACTASAGRIIASLQTLVMHQKTEKTKPGKAEKGVICVLMPPVGVVAEVKGRRQIASTEIAANIILGGK